ncbi:MAG: hypothetical protein ACREPM_13695, partial [Gemmatimonadaceae bacterium]
GFASAPMVEAAIVQLTDDQGDVVVEPVNSEHPLVEKRTTWVNAGKRRPSLAPSRFQMPALRLQLLPDPKTITVTTEPRRDHEIPVRYLDGNEWHDIVEAAGPDRASGGQWSAGYSREYFRCVREDGMMVWMYHTPEQRRRPDASAASGGSTDWFLHGWWD